MVEKRQGESRREAVSPLTKTGSTISAPVGSTKSNTSPVGFSLGGLIASEVIAVLVSVICERRRLKVELGREADGSNGAS